MLFKLCITVISFAMIIYIYIYIYICIYIINIALIATNNCRIKLIFKLFSRRRIETFSEMSNQSRMDWKSFLPLRIIEVSC